MRDRLKALMPQDSFLRNVSILTSGTIFAQGLMVLALPILTRLYTPEDFNLLAVYVSIIGFVTVVSCLRYNFAIPLPEDDVDGMVLLVISLTAACLISLLCALPIILAPEESAALLGQPDLQPFLWMIPAGILIASAYNTLQYWSSRKKRFGLVTRTRVTRAIGGVGTQLGLGASLTSPFGLLMGQMIYGGLGIWGLASDLLRTDKGVYRSLSMRSVSRTLQEYIHFPTRSAPAAIFDAGYQFLPIIILAPVIGAAELGIVFLVIRALGAPVSIVGSSISQVYLASATERLRSGELGPFTRNVMYRTFGLGTLALVVISGILFFFSGAIFGSEFASAGEISLLMMPWFVMQLTCSPVSSIFIVVGRQSAWLMLQFFGFFIIVGGTFLTTRLAAECSLPIFAFTNFIFYLLLSTKILILTYRLEG